MDKRSYFIKAMPFCYNLREWVFSVFSVIVESADAYKSNPYPYRIVRQANGIYFVDPESNNELTELFIADRDEPIYYARELLAINNGDIANYPSEEMLATTYASYLVNYITLVVPFGKTVPYQNGYYSAQAVERILEPIAIDDPAPTDNTPAPEGKVYMRQVTQFADNLLSIVAYNSLFVNSVTKKSMFGHPLARQLRDELMTKYKDQLTDPAIVTRIGDALEALDREWLKDDPSYDFYVQAKSFAITRKKMYYMFGAESAFSDGTVVEFMPRSLAEGIDVEKLPAMINSLREGSFNRGAQTALGGEATKTIYRMMGTVTIEGDDCGTRIGLPRYINPVKPEAFLGFYLIEGDEDTLITPANLSKYIGKSPIMRDPMACKASRKNVCKRCIGTVNTEIEHGLPSAIANTGGVFLSVFLALMHGRVLKTKRYNKETLIF